MKKQKLLALVLSAVMMVPGAALHMTTAEELGAGSASELLISEPAAQDTFVTELPEEESLLLPDETAVQEEAAILLEEEAPFAEAGEELLSAEEPEAVISDEAEEESLQDENGDDKLFPEGEEADCVGTLAAPYVTAVPYSDDAMKVSWNKVSGAKQYKIWISTDNDDYWHRHAVINASKNSIIIGWSEYYGSSLSYGTNYWFMVQAVDSNGDLGTRSNYCIKKLTIASPTNLSVVSRDYKSLRFSWKKLSHADYYYVYMSTSPNSGYKLVERTTYGSSYVTNLVLDRQYYFKVAAYDSWNGWTSSQSHEVHTCPKETPTKFKSVNKSGNNVNVKWYPCKDAKSYDVYRSINGGSYSKIGSLVKNNWFTDKNVKANSTYRYYIRIHYNVAGNLFQGHASEVASINTGSNSSSSSTSTSSTKYRCVLVGEVNYRSASSLPHCEYDMLGMAKMLGSLKNNWSGKYCKDATKSDIMNMITNVSSGMNSNDVFLFFYSGHGYTSSGSMSGALALANGGSVSMSELAAALKKVPGKVIVILDSCGSGAAINKAAGADETFDPDLFNQSAMDAFADVNTFAKEYAEDTDLLTGEAKLGEMLSSKFYVLAGAQKYKYSYTTSNRYTGSMLTNYLVTGAGSNFSSGSYTGSMPMDTNKDKAITLNEAYNYTYSKCYNATRSGNPPQRVQVYPTNSSFKMFFR